MRDDLISRRAVIEAVDKHTKENGTLDDDITVILEEVMTAFDKEKVKQEMKKYSHNFYPSTDHYCLSQKAVDLKKAIEIIEKGGMVNE